MTITSVIPSIVDAVVTLGGTTEYGIAVKVYDGLDIGSEPGSMLLIGVHDSEVDDWQQTGHSDFAWANSNYTAMRETGHIMCTILGWNGDSDVKQARDAAYAIMAALFTGLRTTPALGLAGVLWTRPGAVDPAERWTDDGVIVSIVFSIDFSAYF